MTMNTMNDFYNTNITVKIHQDDDIVSVYVKDLKVAVNECYDIEEFLHINSIPFSKNTLLKISLKTKNPKTPLTMKLPSVKHLVIQSMTTQAMEFHSIPRETKHLRLIHINCFFIEGLIKLDNLRCFQYTSNLVFDIKLHHIAKHLEKLSIHADYLIKDTISNLENLDVCKITLSYFKKISNVQEIQRLLFTNRKVKLHIHLDEDIYDFTAQKASEYITPKLNGMRNPNRIYIDGVCYNKIQPIQKTLEKKTNHKKVNAIVKKRELQPKPPTKNVKKTKNTKNTKNTKKRYA